MKIPVRRVESVAGEVEAVQQQITRRAEELHDRQGGGHRAPLDFWLAAEHELVWRPPIEVSRREGQFVVTAALAGLAPRDIEVRLTATDLLITSASCHDHDATVETVVCEFSPAPLFRAYQFPQPVEPERAAADYTNGLLRITVPRHLDLAPP